MVAWAHWKPSWCGFLRVWFVFPNFSCVRFGLLVSVAQSPAAVSEELEVLQKVMPALGHVTEMKF